MNKKNKSYKLKEEKSMEKVKVIAIEDYNDKYEGALKANPNKIYEVSKERYEMLSNPEKNCYRKALVRKVDEEINQENPVVEEEIKDINLLEENSENDIQK